VIIRIILVGDLVALEVVPSSLVGEVDPSQAVVASMHLEEEPCQEVVASRIQEVVAFQVEILHLVVGALEALHPEEEPFQEVVALEAWDGSLEVQLALACQVGEQVEA